jgi:hypothetical protein
MTLSELIAVVNKGYGQDDILSSYFDKMTGKINPSASGDCLAKFIVEELIQTFDLNSSSATQLKEGMRVIARAVEDLENAHYSLEMKREDSLDY